MLGQKINKLQEEIINTNKEIENKVKNIFDDTFKDIIEINNYELKWYFDQGSRYRIGIPDILNIVNKDICYSDYVISINFNTHNIKYNFKNIDSNNLSLLNAIRKFNDIIMTEDNNEIKEKYGYIYRIVCRDNGKSYIGQHKSKEFDIHYKGSGKALYDKYISLGIADTYKGKVDRDGFDKHFYIELIDWGYDVDELNSLEEKYINEYDTINNGYNIAEGGNGGETINTRKKVLCINENNEIVKEYESLSSTKEDGFDPSLISKVCRGQRKMHKGYSWCYKDESNM